MFLPQDYAWLEPVLILSAIVFVVGLIGNMLSFSNRFVNALVTAILVAVIGGAIFLFMNQGATKTVLLDQAMAWVEPVLVAAGVVFVVDLIGNMLSFGSRFTNALVSAIVFGIVFGGLSYLAYKEGAIPTVTTPVTPEGAPAAPTP